MAAPCYPMYLPCKSDTLPLCALLAQSKHIYVFGLGAIQLPPMSVLLQCAIVYCRLKRIGVGENKSDKVKADDSTSNVTWVLIR